jgi:hypothetical protein
MTDGVNTGANVHRPEDANDSAVCPACEGRRVKVVLPRRGLVVAPQGESGELAPEPDVCSLCAGSGKASGSAA